MYINQSSSNVGKGALTTTSAKVPTSVFNRFLLVLSTIFSSISNFFHKLSPWKSATVTPIKINRTNSPDQAIRKSLYPTPRSTNSEKLWFKTTPKVDQTANPFMLANAMHNIEKSVEKPRIMTWADTIVENRVGLTAITAAAVVSATIIYIASSYNRGELPIEIMQKAGETLLKNATPSVDSIIINGTAAVGTLGNTVISTCPLNGTSVNTVTEFPAIIPTLVQPAILRSSKILSDISTALVPISTVIQKVVVDNYNSAAELIQNFHTTPATAIMTNASLEMLHGVPVQYGAPFQDFPLIEAAKTATPYALGAATIGLIKGAVNQFWSCRNPVVVPNAGIAIDNKPLVSSSDSSSESESDTGKEILDEKSSKSDKSDSSSSSSHGWNNTDNLDLSNINVSMPMIPTSGLNNTYSQKPIGINKSLANNTYFKSSKANSSKSSASGEEGDIADNNVSKPLFQSKDLNNTHSQQSIVKNKVEENELLEEEQEPVHVELDSAIRKGEKYLNEHPELSEIERQDLEMTLDNLRAAAKIAKFDDEIVGIIERINLVVDANYSDMFELHEAITVTDNFIKIHTDEILDLEDLILTENLNGIINDLREMKKAYKKFLSPSRINSIGRTQITNNVVNPDNETSESLDDFETTLHRLTSCEILPTYRVKQLVSPLTELKESDPFDINEFNSQINPLTGKMYPNVEEISFDDFDDLDTILNRPGSSVFDNDLTVSDSHSESAGEKSYSKSDRSFTANSAKSSSSSEATDVEENVDNRKASHRNASHSISSERKSDKSYKSTSSKSSVSSEDFEETESASRSYGKDTKSRASSEEKSLLNAELSESESIEEKQQIPSTQDDNVFGSAPNVFSNSLLNFDLERADRLTEKCNSMLKNGESLDGWGELSDSPNPFFDFFSTRELANKLAELQEQALIQSQNVILAEKVGVDEEPMIRSSKPAPKFIKRDLSNKPAQGSNQAGNVNKAEKPVNSATTEVKEKTSFLLEIERKAKARQERASPIVIEKKVEVQAKNIGNALLDEFSKVEKIAKEPSHLDADSDPWEDTTQIEMTSSKPNYANNTNDTNNKTNSESNLSKPILYDKPEKTLSAVQLMAQKLNSANSSANSSPASMKQENVVVPETTVCSLQNSTAAFNFAGKNLTEALKIVGKANGTYEEIEEKEAWSED